MRKLGFTVQRKSDEVGDTEKESHKDWSAQEVGLIVADYFVMLEAELLGKSFKKSDHRKALAPKLQSRSEGSIEFKHQNVRGVLVELDSRISKATNPGAITKHACQGGRRLP